MRHIRHYDAGFGVGSAILPAWAQTPYPNRTVTMIAPFPPGGGADVGARLSMFDWAPFRTTKAVVKMYTLLGLHGSIPAFIHISGSKMADVKVLDILPVEAGAFCFMDRGYVDFARMYRMH